MIESRLEMASVAGDAPQLHLALQKVGLPTDDLTAAGRVFFSFSRGGEIVGFGGLELYGSDALLRSICVEAPSRGQGIGRLVTGHLLDHAREHGIRSVYLLTETAAPFFETLGFRPIRRADAPAVILQTRQAATLCPASAALLVKVFPE